MFTSPLRRLAAALLIMLGVGASFLPIAQSQQDTADDDVSIDEEWIYTGGLRYPLGWIDDPTFDGGYSMYVSAWPLQQTHPGPGFQTGLPSTWMSSAADAGYSTIEGGLGWWSATRFPIEAPKFTVGAVSVDFFEFANGPAAGGGTEGDFDWQDWNWEQPQGKYGVAQLSPNLLFPPDGLNLAADSQGDLFGYGYHPLPIVDARTSTGPIGQVETGANSWTLFLNTTNFSGPAAFIIPEHWTRPLITDPESRAEAPGASPFLDAHGSAPNQPVDVESHDMPAVTSVADDGTNWAKITRVQFPNNGDGADSIIVSGVNTYRSTALGAATGNWFDGGQAPSGQFAPGDTRPRQFEQWETQDYFGWMIIPTGGEEGDPEHLIDFAAFVDVDVSEGHTFRYRWDLDIVDQVGDQFVIPEYYTLVDDPTAQFGKKWAPASASEVPAETGLIDHEFNTLGVRGNPTAFETPTEPDSPWQDPGPSSPAYHAQLGDGSVVEYRWYKFVDQPAMRFHDFSETELENIQARVEQMHTSWTNGGAYLPAPPIGDLASLDPGVIVQPPAGQEIGYVPIVTRQALPQDPTWLRAPSSFVAPAPTPAPMPVNTDYDYANDWTGKRLLGLGDSIFDFHDVGEDIPEIIADRLGMTMVNRAVSGAHFANPSSADADMGLDIRRQYNDLDDTDFSWVVMDGGFNDLDQRCGCADCIELLDSLISADGRSGQIADFIRGVIGDGPRVMFVGYADMPAEFAVEFCNELLDEHARRMALFANQTNGAWFVDAGEVVTPDMINAYDPDQVHPSVEGSRITGEFVAAQMSATARTPAPTPVAATPPQPSFDTKPNGPPAETGAGSDFVIAPAKTPLTPMFTG